MKMRMLPDRLEIPRIRFLRSWCCSRRLLVLAARSASAAVNAQQRLSKRYPAGKKVRVELKNISGTITVESWNRDEIKLTAILEFPRPICRRGKPAMRLIVDVMADNRGRSDVGNVNFKLAGADQFLS